MLLPFFEKLDNLSNYRNVGWGVVIIILTCLILELITLLFVKKKKKKRVQIDDKTKIVRKDKRSKKF